MNDDFLQRMRKAPPPEFLADLKTRLDRQPWPSVSGRRPSFARGLVVGLLIGGAAFAIASLSINGVPASLHALGAAPGRLFARISPDTQTRGWPSIQSPTTSPRKGARHDPASMPGQVASQTVPVADLAQAPADAKAVSGVSSQDQAAARAAIASTAGAALLWRDYIAVVASPAVYAYTVAAAERFSRSLGKKTPLKVTVDAVPDGLSRLCNGVSTNYPDIAGTARRITAAELHSCARNGVNEIVEVKLGYQAVVFVRSRLYGALKLSSRDVFLALAKRIPDPAHPQTLIDNPNTNWNAVNAALPYERIQVLGPPSPTSVTGQAFAEQLLEAGCNTYPWIAALKDDNPARYDDVCKTLRSDGLYEDSPEDSYAFTEKLAANPAAVGICGYEYFRQMKDRLDASPLEGIEPTAATIAANTYPASRTLYLYLNKEHVAFVPYPSLFPLFLRSYLEDLYYGMTGGWALVLPDPAERAAIRADALALKDLKL